MLEAAQSANNASRTPCRLWPLRVESGHQATRSLGPASSITRNDDRRNKTAIAEPIRMSGQGEANSATAPAATSTPTR